MYIKYIVREMAKEFILSYADLNEGYRIQQRPHK